VSAIEVTIGHFDYPFTLTADGAAVVEQDSVAEVYACVQAIVACPVGARQDLPSFGIPYPEFVNAPVNPSGIRNALAQWEDRAETTITEYGDLVDIAIRHLHIDVQVSE
jgi:phage baseplate assembly protein W